MEESSSSLTATLSRLEIMDAAALALVLGLIIYFTITKQIKYLMFILVLSASLVGSSVTLIANIAPLIRWLLIFLLFFVGLFRGKIKLSPGFVLFLGYAFLGFASLFRADSFSYQFQRSILLLMVAATVPLVYSYSSFVSFQSSLEAIAVAASIYCLFNFSLYVTAPQGAERFSGIIGTSPATFAMVLGGLLIFTFWGVWRTRGWVRLICILGFLTGCVTLVFTGQRTGTIAGIASLIPLFLLVQNKKTIGPSLLLLALLIGITVYFFQNENTNRSEFLESRYALDSGLSGREGIWRRALDANMRSPIFGRGTGAVETFIDNSFHNTYLEVWYNTGFAGLLLFISAGVYFLYSAVVKFFRRKDFEIRAFLAIAIGYMLGFISMGFVESVGAGASNINLILYLFLCYAASTDGVLESVPADVRTEEKGKPALVENPG